MVFVLCCKRHFNSDWMLFLAFLDEQNILTNELNFSISFCSFTKFFCRAQWKVIWNEYFMPQRGEKWTIMTKFYEPKAFSIIYPPCFCRIHSSSSDCDSFHDWYQYIFGIKLLWTLSIILRAFHATKTHQTLIDSLYFFVDVDFPVPSRWNCVWCGFRNAEGEIFMQVCIFLGLWYVAFRKRFISNIKHEKNEAKLELLRKMSSAVRTKMKSTHDPISISSKWPLCVFCSAQSAIRYKTKKRKGRNVSGKRGHRKTMQEGGRELKGL